MKELFCCRMIHTSGSVFLWILPYLHAPAVTFLLCSPHRGAWSGLTPPLWRGPFPDHAAMVWARTSRQVMLWVHIPEGVGLIVGPSTTLETLGLPRKLHFFREESSGFAFGWVACTGCGRCPGPGAAAALDADLPSVLGVCVTPTPGLHCSRWPWAQGNRADFQDVDGCDIPRSVHPSTNTGPRACLKSSLDRTTLLPPLLSWVYFLCFYEAIQCGFQRDKSKCNINI